MAAKTSAKTASKKAGVARPINKDMTLGEVVQTYPQSAMVMMKYGLHCIGCHVSAWETVEQGALGHGLSPKQLDDMVAEMNQVAKALGKTRSNG
ncbi:MAG: DUF1858 domain-containing protein [Candidatus Micrarchaeia archaeon]|jgi:hybrid cluster-associated redox disulfide protein